MSISSMTFISMAAVRVLISVLLMSQALLNPACASSRQVNRIVSLGPLNTENVFLLGAGQRLVGDTIYCVRPEKAWHIEKIGTLTSINIEKIAALRPDLVLATPLTLPTDIKKLRSLGIRVVRFPKPGSFRAICDQFRDLGELLDMAAKADEIIDFVVQEKECIVSAVSGLSPLRVFLQVGADPIYAAVPGSFTNDYIRLGGGINIVADQPTGLIGMEKVLAGNPQVIIIAIMGTETGRAAMEKQRWMQFVTISAVRNGHVYTVDPDLLCSPSPRTFVETLGIVASLIHPEVKDKIAACIHHEKGDPFTITGKTRRAP